MRLLPILASALVLSGCMMVVPIPLPTDGGRGVPAPTARVSTASVRTTPDPAPMQAGGFAAALNSVRAEVGLGSMRPDSRLTAAARAHARDMAVQGYVSHHGKNGSTAQARARAAGCRGGYMAENIAWGQPDEQAVFTGWMLSPPHHRNMMGRPYRVYGLGDHDGMWVLMFADAC